MNLNSPATARLTPTIRPVPSDLMIERATVSPGLPYRLGVNLGGLQAILTLATGLLRPLTKMDPAQSVLTSTGQTDPQEVMRTLTDTLHTIRAQAGPRLLFVAGTRLVGQCPLTVGQTVLIPSVDGAASAGLQVQVTGFALTVSALLGQNATGSWIELGWSAIGPGTDAFDSAVLRPALHGRVFYSQLVDGKIQVNRIDADAPSSGVTVVQPGLNWRMMHDRL